MHVYRAIHTSSIAKYFFTKIGCNYVVVDICVEQKQKKESFLKLYNICYDI